MGVTFREKVELVAYHLKDVTQVWFEQWWDERRVRGGLIDWAVFNMTFLVRFFPLELREKMLLEFMNLR